MPLPQYIANEFEAFLKCGIAAHGFLRLSCAGCSQEKIVAFSCKKRGWCPSCCAKRQAEAALRLLDDILPLAPYRQMVLSFPFPLRFWMQANKKLFSQIHRIALRAMHRHYEDAARRIGIKSPKSGGVSFTQRAGSALNLNPHLHVLMLDGVFTEISGKAHFRNVPRMTDDDVSRLAESISRKVIALLKRQGLLDKEGSLVAHPDVDPIFRDHDSLGAISAASISGRIAFGPSAGQYVSRIGSGFGYLEEIPLAKGRLCFSVNGFSLHCATAINTHSRDRLQKLIEYMARGPLSNERLEIQSDGRVKLKLKTPWHDGTTHLLLSPGEFLEKLAAIIPPPRSHLVKWGGVFAPNSPLRRKVVLKPDSKKGIHFKRGISADSNASGPSPKSLWARLLSQVFKVDVTKCDRCGGGMEVAAAICDPDQARRYLRHVGEDYDPPPRAPPRSFQPHWEEFIEVAEIPECGGLE